MVIGSRPGSHLALLNMSKIRVLNCSCRSVLLHDTSRSPHFRRVALQKPWSQCAWIRMFSLSGRWMTNDSKDGGEKGVDGQSVRKQDDAGELSSSNSSSGSDTDTDTKSQSRRMIKSQKSDIPPIRRKQLASLVKKIKSAQDSQASNRAAYRDKFLSFQDKNFVPKTQKGGDGSMQSRSDRISERSADGSFQRRGTPATLEDVFSGQPFGIFTEEDYRNRIDEPVRTLFDTVEQEENNAAYRQLPQSAFDEQIQWTKEGKMWHFPIDNEQGWEEEKKYSFQDHVFFDEQLKDFPKKGPIRHFMEVVTNALAKNHTLSVEEKHETIEWYRKYFTEHEELLLEKFGEDGIIKQQDKS